MDPAESPALRNSYTNEEIYDVTAYSEIWLCIRVKFEWNLVYHLDLLAERIIA